MPVATSNSRLAETATTDHDANFSVTFRHRLRFTHDVWGADADVLFDLLEPSDGPARVLVIVDADLVAADEDLLPRIGDRFGDRSTTATLVAAPTVVRGGEASKQDQSVVDEVLHAINEADLDRRSYVVAVGGGAMLDAVGYAATIAHRGVRLVRLPTTTLAQADSGVGVKNAINRFGKKNWQGTFAVPHAVINDATLLETLPDREFSAGFSEAVKVALLKDGQFFTELCNNAKQIAGRDGEMSRSAIRQSALWHLRHITAGGDPFEMLEARPLDFGHWSAHRLEAMSGFQLRHGEAVAVGLALDCLYSVETQGLSPAVAERVIGCLHDLGLPVMHSLLRREDDLLAGLEEFRQHLGGRLTITLLQDVARPIDVHDIDDAVMRRCLRDLVDRADGFQEISLIYLIDADEAAGCDVTAPPLAGPTSLAYLARAPVS